VTTTSDTVRILAIYNAVNDDEPPRCVQIDLARETGMWQLTRLLARGDLEQIRLVGETEASVNAARMLVAAGRFRQRSTPPAGVLRRTNDESYPRHQPFIYINPRPDPAAFE
jgi:hypothetical protein